ncbi:MAG: CvpA family protein [Gemmataceae bacterium]|nr:CvpA family protein [Gemmataceae bacterium]
MHWLDTAIVAILLVGAVLGFLTGFVWQLARIGGLILSVYASAALHEPASRLVRDVLRDCDERIASAAAYVVVFVLVFVGMYVTAMTLKGILRTLDLENLDRIAGALFGVAKAALCVGVACLLLQYWAHPMTREWMTKTQIAPAMAQGTEQAIALIPPSYKQAVLEGFAELRERLASNAAKSKRDDRAEDAHPELPVD